MTRAQAKKHLAVIEAFAQGKDIQFKGPDGIWYDTYADPVFSEDEYRVKPTPREIWLNCYGGVLGQIHTSKEAADDNADEARTECIHFVEVLP